MCTKAGAKVSVGTSCWEVGIIYFGLRCAVEDVGTCTGGERTRSLVGPLPSPSFPADCHCRPGCALFTSEESHGPGDDECELGELASKGTDIKM